MGLLTNEKFLQRLKDKGRDDLIPLEDYKGTRVSIKFQCTKNPKHIWKNTPVNILGKEQGCPYCAPGNKILEDDDRILGTSHPEFVKYFQNPEDAFKYSSASRKKFYFKCPDCGKIKKKSIQIDTLVRYGFSCDFCKETVSFPNRLIRNLAFQLKDKKMIEDFELEYTILNHKEYRYDCFLDLGDKKIIIEMQGQQHYNKNNPWNKNNNQERVDFLKRELALSGGYIFFVIDCKNSSDFNYIKDNLLNSGLGNYINFKNIDWKSILENCQLNLTKEICERYEKSKPISLSKFSKEVKMGKVAVKNRLKVGNEIGWCVYPPIKPEKPEKKQLYKNKTYLYKDEQLIGEYDSVEEAEKYIRLQTGGCSHQPVLDCIRGKIESYKGYRIIREKIRI